MREGNINAHDRCKPGDFIDMYTDVDKIEAAWAKDRSEQRRGKMQKVSVGSVVDSEECSNKSLNAQHNDQVMGFIQKNFPGSFTKYDIYEKAKVSKARLRECGLWDTYEHYAVNHVDFLHPKLDPNVVMRVSYQITKIFAGSAKHHG